jgi:lysozyme
VTSPYLASDLRRDEGLRLHAYPDPLSGGEPWTCGYGHTGADVGPDTVWTLAQAEDALAADIAAACRGLDVVLPWWRSLDDVRQDCLVNQAFNLGCPRLLTFTTYLSLVKTGDYAAAATDELHTAWAREVGARATRLAEQMRTGVHVGADDLAIPPAPVAPPVVAKPLPPLPAPPEPVVVQTPPVTPVAGPIVHPMPADDVPLMLAMWAGLGAFLVGCVVWLVTLFHRPKAKAPVPASVVQTQTPEKETPMSWASKFIFDPIKAAIARATTSSNPAVAAGAVSVQTTYNQVSTTINSAANNGLSTNSAAGVANDLIGQLENGLLAAADAFITGGLASTGPVGAALAPEAVAGANALLTFGEQHAMTYIAALFSHARTQAVAAPAPVVVTPSIVAS